MHKFFQVLTNMNFLSFCKLLCASEFTILQIVVVVVVEFCNKTLSNAKQTMKMQADNTDTQNEHQCKQSSSPKISSSNSP